MAPSSELGHSPSNSSVRNDRSARTLSLTFDVAGGRFTALHPLGSLDDHLYACDEAELRFLCVDPLYAERAGQLLERSSAVEAVFTFGPASVGEDINELVEAVGAVTPDRGPHGPDDVAWLLGVQPNEETNAFEWRQVTLKDCLLWGNSYSEIERDGMGRPKALWRIDPWRVCVERNSAGQLYYEIQNGASSGPDVLFPFEVFHTKGLGPDGLVGYSVIEMARRSILQTLRQPARVGTFAEARDLDPGRAVASRARRRSIDRARQRRFLGPGAQRANLDPRRAETEHVESRCSRVGQIDQTIGMERSAIVDPNHDAATVVEIGDACIGRQRQGPVRGAEGVHVVGL